MDNQNNSDNQNNQNNISNQNNLGDFNYIENSDKLDSREAFRTINCIGIALFLFLAVSHFVQYPLVDLLLLIDGNMKSQPWFTVLVTLLCIYGVAFPIFCFFISKIPAKAPNGNKKYTIKEILVLFAICYASSIVLNVFSILINYLISLVKGAAVVNPMEVLITGPQYIYVAFMSCVIAPIMEEIAFRKILLNRLNRLGSGVAIIVSAYAFAVFHGNLSQFFYAFFLGVIFAYITIKSGTIKYSMTIHLMVNLMGSVVAKQALDLGGIFMMIFGLLIWVLVISGIILFFQKRKTIFTKIEDTPNSISAIKAIFSPGMLLFMAIGIAVIVSFIINC